MENEINNLKKYGQAFQTKCIGILLSDRMFLERILDILSSDYFETDAHKWIVKFIIGYFPTYKSLPTLDVFKVEMEKISDVVLQTAIREQIKGAFIQIGSADSTYVKEQFLEFCKNQKLKNAIWTAETYLRQGNYEGIWNVINEASKAGTERNLGHDYFSDMDARLIDVPREVIKTNWPIIDGHLDGGLGKGELGFIVAPAGSGKSWFLTRLGTEALRQGKNVMHFTMELNEKYVGLRYDSAFSGISFQDIRKHPDLVKQKLEVIKPTCGKLFVKYFPLKTASAATLKMHIDRLQLVHGITIDMMIVDYADILRPFTIEKHSNSYNDAGSVYEELRTVLGELQIPGWTASQSNRGAHEEEIIEADDVADSYRKIMTGDFIMALSRKMKDKIAGTGRVSIMKSRFGSDGVMYPCEFDASTGKIEIYDSKSVEGMEIFKKSNDVEKNMEEIFKKKWNEKHNH